MSDAAAMANYLANPDNAVRAADYQWTKPELLRAGLYSWWVDDEGAEALSRSLGEGVFGLIYAGQTGASSSRAAKPSSATLKSRIHGNHLNGTAYGSTFRKTLSALLLEPLQLRVEARDRLAPADNKRVSQWMLDHLSLIVFPFDDRAILGSVESAVLAIIDPPLNLEGMTPTPVRRRVKELRRALTQPAPVPSEPVKEALAEPPPVVDRVRYMVPSGGPEGWRMFLAEPDLHWVRGRSARTLAYCWESSGGWPSEVAALLASARDLAGFRAVYGFPELKTVLPGGRRESQTDLMVLAVDGHRSMTMGVEGKVDESFGPLVSVWHGEDPSPGKKERLRFLCDLLCLDENQAWDLRYQLIHRAASAKLEGARNGSDVAVMLVHSWGPRHEGFDDFSRFANQLGVHAGVGLIGYSESAELWLGWAVGDPRYLQA